MSFTTDLFTHLTSNTKISSLIATRLYYGNAPTSAPFPFVTYSFVSHSPIHSVEGGSELEERRVQFDIYSNSGADVEAVREALRNVIDGFQGSMGAEDIRFTRMDQEIERIEFSKETANQNQIFSKIIDFVFMRRISKPTP